MSMKVMENMAAVMVGVTINLKIIALRLALALSIRTESERFYIIQEVFLHT